MAPTTTHLTPVPPETGSVACATDRLVAKLADPDAVFTRDQVAYLMGTAQRWGYETREAEENDEWLAQRDVQMFFAGEHFAAVDRKRRRDEWDAAARLPRPGDFKGGLPLPSTQMEEEQAA